MPSLRRICRSEISGKAVAEMLEGPKRKGIPKGRQSDMVSYAEFSGVVDLAFHQNRADRLGG